jgi:CRP-like cAMP-binding protein
MESQEVGELFPLFNTASPETLEWFLEIAKEQDFSAEETVLKEGDWGKAVFWIVAGWVKVRSLAGEREVTLEIFSRGDCFGEMAILNESLPATEVVALSEVKLLSISAQRFLQMLFKEPPLQNRLLQLTFRRVGQFYRCRQLRYQSSRMKLGKLLIFLADNYGKSTEKGTKIFNVSLQDLADLAEINIEDARQVMGIFNSKRWLNIDDSNLALYLTNVKQFTHLVGQL